MKNVVNVDLFRSNILSIISISVIMNRVDHPSVSGQCWSMVTLRKRGKGGNRFSSVTIDQHWPLPLTLGVGIEIGYAAILYFFSLSVNFPKKNTEPFG